MTNQDSSDYMDEIVIRSAPRWAWDIIEETLASDASDLTVLSHRGAIKTALAAMVEAGDEPELKWISRR
ncbi:hypothetical protein LCGC14_1179950 [marine sediment metagenome]|uniref:Uncharacterized protein n=1 Tax=marine sediment metagenome TaxID=412755 RepID=A0A0F9LS79_9ZZZZ